MKKDSSPNVSPTPSCCSGPTYGMLPPKPVGTPPEAVSSGLPKTGVRPLMPSLL